MIRRATPSEGNVILVGEEQGQIVSTCYLNLIPNLTGSKKPSTLRFYEGAGLKAKEKTGFHTRL